MQLSIEELNYLLNAIDTHVRANGITGAAVAVAVVDKLQAAAKVAGAQPDDGQTGDE